MARKYVNPNRDPAASQGAVPDAGPVPGDADSVAAAGFLRRVAERAAINLVGTLRVRAAGDDLGRLDVAAGVVAAMAVQVRSGGTAVSGAGLTEAQRYQVSAMLKKARERAREENAPPKVAAVLVGVATGWDKSADVTEQTPSLHAWIAAGRPAGVQPRDLGM